MAFSSEKHKSLFPLVLFLLVFVSLTCLCQSTNTSSSNTTQTTSSPSSNGTLMRIPGCKTGLNPIYRYLCDRRQRGASCWRPWPRLASCSASLCSSASSSGPSGSASPSRTSASSIGGTVFSMSLFLLATAGIFAITFSFIIRHTSQT
ncbi:hypothetical protein KUCAC02_008254, partial [Chaenocephalus aceratus]